MKVKLRIGPKDNAGDKEEWLHTEYTVGARLFYSQVRDDILDRLILAAGATKDPVVARYYEQYVAATEMVAFLTSNEQRRNSDDD